MTRSSFLPIDANVITMPKADQILEQLRTLSPAERLRLVEQVVHELAAELTPPPPSPVRHIWADESDAEFEVFESRVERLRSTDVWRTGDDTSAG